MALSVEANTIPPLERDYSRRARSNDLKSQRKDIKLTLYVTPTLYEIIKEYCKTRDTSVSELIRRSVISSLTDVGLLNDEILFRVMR